MKKQSFVLLACTLLFTGLLSAQTPVDSQVASAMADIEKYEAQFAGQTNVNPTTIKRSLKLLELTRGRLDSSTNQSDPSWIAADVRYIALVAQLNGMLSPSQPASGPSSSAAMAPATGPTAAAPLAAPTTAAQMISQQRVRLQKLLRDIDSRLQTMDKNGVKPFQSPEYVENCQNSLNNFRLALEKYSDFADDPEVIAVAQRLVTFDNMMIFGQQQAAATLAELGDVQSRLREINQGMHAITIPATPQEPYQQGQLSQWIDDLIAARNQAMALYEPLPLIKEKAYLVDTVQTVEEGGAFDMQDINRMERGLAGTAEKIDASVHAFTDHLLMIVNAVEDELVFYNGFDPADPDQQSNHFLQEGRADEIRAELAQDYSTVSEAASYEERLKHDTYDHTKAVLENVRNTTQLYEANYARALELVRMPKPASSDTDLIEIAEETLANYEDVGDIKRLVINADRRHLSKETSETQVDDLDVSLSGTVTLSGTKTTYFYEWDEFQVATAEPVGSQYYIFYSKLKYFTSGSETTPLNRWIIASRFQGNLIPGANIGKD